MNYNKRKKPLKMKEPRLGRAYTLVVCIADVAQEEANIAAKTKTGNDTITF